MPPNKVAIVGAGPAGLMAAEALAASGLRVDLYDAMPSAGRKFLLAGKGGLNLTHSEAFEPFLTRYGTRQQQIEPWLRAFGATELRAWAQGLGIDTFVGTSGRVFPTDMKAAPLLRAWLHRLREAGMRFHMRHRWQGLAASSGNQRSLRFATPTGELQVQADAVVLALGGASWARLGSDGAWVPWLRERGVEIAPLQPANCGFDAGQGAAAAEGRPAQGWSEHFRSRHAGEPLKPVVLSFASADGLTQFKRTGEFIITEGGVEGSLIYAASALLRDEIAATGEAVIHLDLLPAHDAARVLAEVSHPRGSRSMASHLQSRLGLHGVKAALLREVFPASVFNHPAELAAAIKALPLRLVAPRPIDEAISTAGGVSFDALDESLMLCALPGVFCAGEMLDWEAPTGGYLLTACFASGRVAAEGVLRRLGKR